MSIISLYLESICHAELVEASPLRKYKGNEILRQAQDDR